MSINITIPDDQWDAVGDSNRHELVTSITINERIFHLEAIEVAIDEANKMHIQYALGDDEHFNALAEAFNAEGHYETITIAGREYALFGDIAC